MTEISRSTLPYENAESKLLVTDLDLPESDWGEMGRSWDRFIEWSRGEGVEIKRALRRVRKGVSRKGEWPYVMTALLAGGNNSVFLGIPSVDEIESDSPREPAKKHSWMVNSKGLEMVVDPRELELRGESWTQVLTRLVNAKGVADPYSGMVSIPASYEGWVVDKPMVVASAVPRVVRQLETEGYLVSQQMLTWRITNLELVDEEWNLIRTDWRDVVATLGDYLEGG